MDDVTVGGFREMVAKDIQTVTKVEHDTGLNINVSKCELIAYLGCNVTDPSSLSFQQIPTEDAELLGATLFPGMVLDHLWTQRCNELTRAVDRLDSIGSQDVLVLLTVLFIMREVLNLLCCSPSADNPHISDI